MLLKRPGNFPSRASHSPPVTPWGEKEEAFRSCPFFYWEWLPKPTLFFCGSFVFPPLQTNCRPLPSSVARFRISPFYKKMASTSTTDSASKPARSQDVSPTLPLHLLAICCFFLFWQSCRPSGRFGPYVGLTNEEYHFSLLWSLSR